MSTIFDITKELLARLEDFFLYNLRNIAIIIDTILPFLMFALGWWCIDVVDYGMIFLIWFGLPALAMLISAYLNASANRIGRGNSVPLPGTRFTDIDEDGEVSIENDRLQELILYVADLEDWAERKGLK